MSEDDVLLHQLNRMKPNELPIVISSPEKPLKYNVLVILRSFLIQLIGDDEVILIEQRNTVIYDGNLIELLCC